MKHHIDHSPTLVYDISIDTDDIVSLTITQQDPEFTAWLQEVPFTKGPLPVKSDHKVLLLFDRVFLCGSSSIVGVSCGTSDTNTPRDAYEYVNKVNVSISMAIDAFIIGSKETIDHSPFITYTIGIDKDVVKFKIDAQCAGFTKWLSVTGGHLSVQSNGFPGLDGTTVLLRGDCLNRDNQEVYYTPTGSPLEFVNKVKLAISQAVKAYRDRDDTEAHWIPYEPTPISVGPYKISWDNMYKDLEKIGFHFGEVVMIENVLRRLFAYDSARDILYANSTIAESGIVRLGTYDDNKNRFLRTKKKVVTIDKEYYAPVPRDD